MDVPSGINENKCESVVKVHSPEDGAANRPEIPDPGSSAVLKYESKEYSFLHMRETIKIMYLACMRIVLCQRVIFYGTKEHFL